METLKQLIDKLSQYSFLTNILPGAVLVVVLKYVVGYDLIIYGNWFLTGVMFYFAGMVCNRFSSLLIKPLLEAMHIVKPLPYKDYNVFWQTSHIPSNLASYFPFLTF